MVINAQKVGAPRIHTVVQANIKNPRKYGLKSIKNSASAEFFICQGYLQAGKSVL